MRALIVDDDALNRQILSASLARGGHEVETAPSGERAMELLRAEAFDVVLSDVFMPGMDGFQLCMHMRRDPAPDGQTPLYTQIVVPGLPPACQYRATFLGDVTLPDNAVVAVGAPFVKTWRLRNDGTCAWGPNASVYAVTNINAALEANPRSATDTTSRNQALSELYLARALYRCGDYEGLGEKTLREYSRDLHGHYARHAKAVLKTATGPVE